MKIKFQELKFDDDRGCRFEMFIGQDFDIPDDWTDYDIRMHLKEYVIKNIEVSYETDKN